MDQLNSNNAMATSSVLNTGTPNVQTASNNNASTINSNSILTNNINITNNINKILNTSPASYKILFTLINGSTKQFHQLCKHICNLISMNYSQVHSHQHRQNQQQLLQHQRQVEKVNILFFNKYCISKILYSTLFSISLVNFFLYFKYFANLNGIFTFY